MSQTARFQSFEDPSHREGAARVAALRAAMAQRGVAGFVVPRADEHQSEYVPANAERLAWLTGFTGSAGTAIVLADKAALVVDGRYTLQAAEQVDTAIVTPVPLAETSVEAWIEANLPAGGVLAYDPWLHTPDGLARLERAAQAAGGRVEATALNLVDLVWIDRPAAPRAPVVPHPDHLAGEAAAAKLDRVRAALDKARLDALVVSDPHNLAWAFNLRGGDVSPPPLPLGYAVIPRDGLPRLFLDARKVTAEALAALDGLAERHDPEALTEALDALGAGKARVRLDAATGAVALRRRIEAAGGSVDVGPDPITAMKAAKNAAEIAGTRAAHRRDGAAVTRFLAWLAREAPGGAVSEIDAVVRLEAFRAETGLLREIAFPTISGSGPNGAIVHYRVSRGTDRRVQPGELFLIDSGAQYADGTTDITRTVAVGTEPGDARPLHPGAQGPHRHRHRGVSPRHHGGADRFLRPAPALGGRPRLRPRHRPRRRRLPVGARGAAAHRQDRHGGAPARDDRLERARLLQGAGLRHPPREPGSGRGDEPAGCRATDARLRDPDAGAVRPRAGGPGAAHPAETAWLDAYHARVRAALDDLVDPETRTWLAAATRPLAEA